MLSVPMEFSNSKIMEGAMGEESHSDPIKLSMNFDTEETLVSDSKSCLGCGNCLAGCPYDAKNSTDKTYLASAIQAGCSIKTECEVEYVLRNYKESRTRKWLVFVNEFDYIESDIVILSAGVFGTTKILFQSQIRGLRVSHKLGSGLSCNGNNVAYLAGSSSPLNATGLDRKQFPNIPFHERPGPSISSSYTSSLGFTIQYTKTPYTQYMNYHLILAASSGSRYVLEGKKVMNPFLLGIYAWRESTTLDVTVRKITDNMPVGDDNITGLKGKLHISLVELLKSAWALEGRNRFKFICRLLGSVFRTYIVQAPRQSLVHVVTPMNSGHEPYPTSTIHEIKTEDSLTISCEHWQCNHKHKDEIIKYPALLLNGYSTESYRLPTEKNDLVRTLLKDGHDVWVLLAREHCSISSNQFSVEDIGRFDIPAAINKMIDSYGESIKVHVVAHCLGGLAIHISLMGGHVSPNFIASLCCTNSSMFYKVTASSLVKMWLPIVPMSMSILGNNKTLPTHKESSITYRHSLLKSIARLIPRYQRCHFDECEVLSGIFGNIYLHENISDSMHHWMHKENMPTLTMAAFPHLRKICKTGVIVDAKGNNSYLIYPERMAMPTLYISGGRALIVTVETSFLGNKYMKMHQPGYRHDRVAIDGFGHNDLLIGEKSGDFVFPHIRKHVELAEEDIRDRLRSSGEYHDKKCVKERLAWSVDPYEDEEGILIGSLVFSLIGIVLLVMFFRLFFFS